MLLEAGRCRGSCMMGGRTAVVGAVMPIAMLGLVFSKYQLQDLTESFVFDMK